MKFRILWVALFAIVSLLCSFVSSEYETPPGPYVGYLFLHYYDHRSGYDGYGEQVYGHLSNGNNAVSFRPLNGGSPLLRSNIGSGGVRDFYIASKGDESQHYLIATDLNSTAQGFAGPLSQSIVVWDSYGPSLTKWRKPRLAKFVPDNFRMVWAPEAYWIDNEQRFIVFWTSSKYADASRTGALDYNKIYYSYTTDFDYFTTPMLYLDLETESVIDFTMHWTGSWNHFVRCFRKESIQKCHLQSSDSGPFGPFGDIGTADQSVDDQHPSKGCLFFPDNVEETWWVWLDENGRDPVGYYAYKADNGILNPGWTDQGHATGFPPNTRQGCVKKLTQAQYDEVSANWG